MKYYLVVLLSIFCFSSCGSGEETGVSSPTVPISKQNDKQLNINVLLDLSDRISPMINPATPEHYVRDIEIIKTLTEVFKADMEKKGAYSAKGKIKVFFTPPPADQQVNEISQNLVQDLSKYKEEGANIQKKKVHDSITQKFESNARKIYELTIDKNKDLKDWDGSDLWRFFKNDVDRCIDRDSSYRNILVILTDGYIYHSDSRNSEKNRFQYITTSNLKIFRGKTNWIEIFNSGDFGLITTRNDLQNLEVLVLGINPTPGNRNDEDYIKAYLEKWFTEMNVKKIKMHGTGLPQHTRDRIIDFFEN